MDMSDSINRHFRHIELQHKSGYYKFANENSDFFYLNDLSALVYSIYSQLSQPAVKFFSATRWYPNNLGHDPLMSDSSIHGHW